MTRLKCDLGILALGLIGFSFTSHVSSGASENKEPVTKGLHLQFELDKHNAVSGDTIQYRASLPSDKKVEAASISFHVERIGIFHRGLGRLVHLDDPMTIATSVSTAFADLPIGEAGSHGLEFNFHDQLEFRQGVADKFRALKAGNYLVWAEWQLRKPNGTLKSNTVYLQVSPRNDSNGKPVIDDNTCSGDDLDEQVRLEATFDALSTSWAKSRE